MTAKYRIFPMMFHVALWRQTMRALSPEMLIMLSAATKIAPGTIAGWRNLREGGVFEHPSMSNFISVCNALDLNPSDFFILSDGGHDE